MSIREKQPAQTTTSAAINTYISLLSPRELQKDEYHNLSETAFHDLGMDQICSCLTNKPEEQSMFRRVMSQLVSDPEVVQYRCDVFADILKFPKMRDEMLKLLEKVNYLQDYVRKKREFDRPDGAWDLLHRLGEISDYIECVEQMYQCLDSTAIQSEGLNNLKDVLAGIYHDCAFEELKKDISALKASTANLKSATIGINLNDRFEADSIGLISINDKAFTQSNILSGFLSKMSSRDGVKHGNEWNGSYTYQEVNSGDVNAVAGLEKLTVAVTAGVNPLMGVGLGLARMQSHEQGNELLHYMDRITNQVLGSVVKELKSVLSKYVTVTIYRITGLVPEFIYYIRWAEYMEKLQEKGVPLCEARIASEDAAQKVMHAKGLYNLKLAVAAVSDNQNVTIDPEEGSYGTEGSDRTVSDTGNNFRKSASNGNRSENRIIVTNDLDFDSDHRVYILTGANRGGKTTITQAVGQLFVLAQGGIYVPARSFSFHPVDNIFTHFPADEDKTMDYGRLGEECSRFKELYGQATADSLILLNETFSTTSFEEGYYIARDASRAILKKGIRTIYNTHMHKLALEMEEIDDGSFENHAASLVMRSEEGNRSYKVDVAPPEGLSYAKDIAEKYGVTYEMLVQ